MLSPHSSSFQLGDTRFEMTVLNPSKRVLMKCTFTDTKGRDKREREMKSEKRVPGFVKVKRALGDKGKGNTH